jgi:hypothetical protein
MKIHGETKLSWHLDTLIVDAHGPFNEEGAQYFKKSFESALLTNKRRHWHRIDILDNETLGSPEVLNIVKQSIAQAFKANCLSVAIVAANTLQAQLFTQMANELALTIKVFHSLDNARQWQQSLSGEK